MDNIKTTALYQPQMEENERRFVELKEYNAPKEQQVNDIKLKQK